MTAHPFKVKKYAVKSSDHRPIKSFVRWGNQVVGTPVAGKDQYGGAESYKGPEGEHLHHLYLSTGLGTAQSPRQSYY